VVASCRTSCGTSGIENCGAAGTWSACATYETCDGIDNDCDGIVDNGSVCQTPHSAWDPKHGYGWDTWLDGCKSTAASSTIAAYHWDVDLPGGTKAVDATTCSARFTFPAEATYDVRLTVVDQRGNSKQDAGKVTIRNFVVASIGDSLASGEGDPDQPASDVHPIPTWTDRRCHRSMSSGHALAAREMETSDDHTSVTFSLLACSGATINGGLIGRYAGEEVVASDTPRLLPPQISDLGRIMSAQRSIDVLFLQIGANDVGFGSLVESCAAPTLIVPDMGDVLTCANDNAKTHVATALTQLETTGYRELKDTLIASLPFDDAHVYVSEYPDPTHDDDGAFCNEIRLTGAITDKVVDLIPDPKSSPFLSVVGIKYLTDTAPDVVKAGLGAANLSDGVVNATEVAWAHDNVIVPLNATLGRAVSANGWTFVPGETKAFATHGYCAGAHWVRRYDESKALQVDHDGTLHPNPAGHSAYQRLLYAAVAKDFGLPPPFDPTDAGSADTVDASLPDLGADAGAASDAGTADGGAADIAGTPDRSADAGAEEP
jgi:lysophospholipase L1-like esterase